MKEANNKDAGWGSPSHRIWREEVLEVSKVNPETLRNRAQELLAFIKNEEPTLFL